MDTSGLDETKLIWMYRTMLAIRGFEVRIRELFTEGRIGGLLHSYEGEEAVATGVCAALRPDDLIVSTHRGHGHLIAKGGSLDRMMAELFARETGYCRAKGGSAHMVDVSLGILGANGIVGAGLPIATGAGTAVKLRRTGQVVVCFFGDGASNTGAFHEAVNLASVWALPIVFVCENNLYAQFVRQELHSKLADLHQRSVGYAMPGCMVDGNDVLAVYEVTTAAVARARAGEGPSLIEAKTYRYTGHAISNPASALGRSVEEVEAWKKRDPIERMARLLSQQGVLTPELDERLHAEIDQAVEASIAFAEASPHPRPEEALEDVYASLPEGARL